MKKKLLALLFLIALSATCSITFAKSTTNPELATAIKLYKAGNYAECYTTLDNVIKKDPSNPLCYYYKAMTSAQIGKKAEAIENYEKALALAPSRSNLAAYAEKGKRCLETPDRCQDNGMNDMEQFIKSKTPSGFSEEAREMFERLRIEQMMRDMNRQDDIDPQRFKEYRDFSSMSTPTNDEIVSAVKTLQKAGLVNFGINTYSDLSILTGSDNRSMSGLMNMSNMNPQLIQAMFTNNMSLGL